jgi:hypothetical protein
MSTVKAPVGARAAENLALRFSDEQLCMMLRYHNIFWPASAVTFDTPEEAFKWLSDDDNLARVMQGSWEQTKTDDDALENYIEDAIREPDPSDSKEKIDERKARIEWARSRRRLIANGEVLKNSVYACIQERKKARAVPA